MSGKLFNFTLYSHLQQLHLPRRYQSHYAISSKKESASFNFARLQDHVGERDAKFKEQTRFLRIAIINKSRHLIELISSWFSNEDILLIEITVDDLLWKFIVVIQDIFLKIIDNIFDHATLRLVNNIHKLSQIRH